MTSPALRSETTVGVAGVATAAGILGFALFPLAIPIVALTGLALLPLAVPLILLAIVGAVIAVAWKAARALARPLRRERRSAGRSIRHSTVSPGATGAAR